jgi:hypothetical protein
MWFALGVIDHRERRRRSTSVDDSPSALTKLPTATHVRSGWHDTSLIVGLVAAAGSGSWLGRHRRPSQPSANSSSARLRRDRPPTATQSRLDEHDSEVRLAAPVRDGDGSRVTIHRSPVKRAKNRTARRCSSNVPATTQSMGEPHHTAASSSPARRGALALLQRAPFHCSTNGRSTHGPSGHPCLGSKNPTAMHATANAHDTSASPKSHHERKVRTGISLHLRPSHRCTSSRVSQPPPPHSVSLPTATQNVRDSHDTPVGSATVSGAGLCRDHRRPSHRSNNGRVAESDPTAVQARAELQSTASSSARGPPAARGSVATTGRPTAQQPRPPGCSQPPYTQTRNCTTPPTTCYREPAAPAPTQPTTTPHLHPQVRSARPS